MYINFGSSGFLVVVESGSLKKINSFKEKRLGEVVEPNIFTVELFSS